MVYLQKSSSLVDIICNTIYNSLSVVVMVIPPSISAMEGCKHSHHLEVEGGKISLR